MDGWEVPVFAVLDVNSKVHMAGAGGLGPEEKESSVTAGRAISTATRIPVRKHIIQEPGSLASAGFGLGLSTHRIRAARTGRAGTREEARRAVVLVHDEVGVSLVTLQRNAHDHLTEGGARKRVCAAEGLRAKQHVDAERASLSDETVEQESGRSIGNIVIDIG